MTSLAEIYQDIVCVSADTNPQDSFTLVRFYFKFLSHNGLLLDLLVFKIWLQDMLSLFGFDILQIVKNMSK